MRVSLDPRQVPGFVYLRLTPQRMLVWRHLGEFQGREVMREGRWAAA